MNLDECKRLKIGDAIFVKSPGGGEYEAEITGFDYKAVLYKYLDGSGEPKKAMYYDIERKMTDAEVEAFLQSEVKRKKQKTPRCPDCKKPIDKCKCYE